MEPPEPHRLTDLDTTGLLATATCSICGPVRVRVRVRKVPRADGSHREEVHATCATVVRAQRQRQRRRQSPSPPPGTMVTATCDRCAEEFSYVKPPRGRLRKRCDACAVPMNRMNPAQRAEHRAKPRFCRHCGGLMPEDADRRARYCPSCPKEVRFTRPTPDPGTCVVCGVLFEPKQKKQITCSRTCGDVRRGKVNLSDRCLVRYGPCDDCSRLIVHRGSRHRCPDCMVRRLLARRDAQGAARRARKSGQETINARAVAARDGWRCHLCGGPIPDRPFSGWANDLTVDHLVPISQGGRHILSNVKAAHYLCNSERQDAPLPEGMTEWDALGVVA